MRNPLRLPRNQRLRRALLAAALLSVVAAPPARGASAPRRPTPPASGMVRLPAGRLVPLYAPRGARSVHVDAFALDREPVTRGEFLTFVKAHPAWRKSTVRRAFAERDYLAGWRGDLDAGDATDLRRPVTGVSWFAARAYCAARGKRLPTVHEWEYAAQASDRSRDASRDPAFRRTLLRLYGARRADAIPPVGAGLRNVYGVRDLHDLVWEWTLDFNDVLVPDDSRDVGSGVGARDHALFCASAAIGSTDPSNYPAFLRSAFRAGLEARSTLRTLGFRCAAGA